MNVAAAKKDLILRGKNGLPFLLAAAIVWALITIVFLLPFNIQLKNILLLAMTTLTFPLAVGISKLIKADWKVINNPLGSLGLYLNLAQFVYFPIVLWAFAQRPEVMVVLFAIIIGAHLFPYGWLYNAKAYYIMGPVIAAGSMIIGWIFGNNNLWAVPAAMIVFLLLLAFLLYKHYREIARTHNENSL